MITRKLERVYFRIFGKDESGLIPEGAKGCIVGYEVSGRSKNPIYVDFDPNVELRQDTFQSDNEKYIEESKRLNPKRTEKEIKEIANLLESRLDDFN